MTAIGQSTRIGYATTDGRSIAALDSSPPSIHRHLQLIATVCPLGPSVRYRHLSVYCRGDNWIVDHNVGGEGVKRFFLPEIVVFVSAWFFCPGDLRFRQTGWLPRRCRASGVGVGSIAANPASFVAFHGGYVGNRVEVCSFPAQGAGLAG